MKLDETNASNADRRDERDRMAGLVVAITCSGISLFMIVLSIGYFSK